MKRGDIIIRQCLTWGPNESSVRNIVVLFVLDYRSYIAQKNARFKDPWMNSRPVSVRSYSLRFAVLVLSPTLTALFQKKKKKLHKTLTPGILFNKKIPRHKRKL